MILYHVKLHFQFNMKYMIFYAFNGYIILFLPKMLQHQFLHPRQLHQSLMNGYYHHLTRLFHDIHRYNKDYYPHKYLTILAWTTPVYLDCLILQITNFHKLQILNLTLGTITYVYINTLYISSIPKLHKITISCFK